MSVQNKLEIALAQRALRAKAAQDLKTFLLLKWEKYKNSQFLDNWHYDYLCKILEATTPFRNNCEIITRLMFNMPPSYGKTEVIARTFIAWCLGNDRRRKFIYISYSDDLCRKIANEVRDLIKSDFWAQVFKNPPVFLQDNANEFILKEGGGLFVTTLKSAITGFHAHQILIDDPIKVADLGSKTERNRVNQNFKESVLSRLQNNQSNITILMQRLHDDDLCGFLTNPKNYDEQTISQWKQVTLKAIEKENIVYEIGDYKYSRKAGEPLFAQRHTTQELESLKLQMGNDEFSTQYLQEPMVSSAGYFEEVYFKTIPSYECKVQNQYIFVDCAMSMEASADNRAMVAMGVESANDGGNKYVVLDCLYGIWDERQIIENLIELMQKYPKARVFIESEGGGLVMHRLLLQELVKINTLLKNRGGAQILNDINVYTPSRKISKVEKIKAMRPYFNIGSLVFLHTAAGLEQIKKELFGFNPAKPFKKDDCIDCIASAIISDEVRAPAGNSSGGNNQNLPSFRRFGNARVAWNF